MWLNNLANVIQLVSDGGGGPNSRQKYSAYREYVPSYF